MIAHTHRFVGEFLYHQLPDYLRKQLDHNKFVNGNVKPDVVKAYRQMSHYYRDNEEFVFGLFEKLMTEPMSKSEFSDLLGVLMHFLCDYTCVYHANDYIHKEHSIRLHMQYEMKFHMYAHRRFRSLREVDIIPFQSVDEVREYVRDLIKRTNTPNFKLEVESDFNEMVSLTVGVLFFILTDKKT